MPHRRSNFGKSGGKGKENYASEKKHLCLHCTAHSSDTQAAQPLALAPVSCLERLALSCRLATPVAEFLKVDAQLVIPEGQLHHSEFYKCIQWRFAGVLVQYAMKE